MPTRPQVIALEEHFHHPEVAATYGPLDANRAPAMVQRLEDLGELRIKEMDAAGIDIQVLSHSAPAMQKMTDAPNVPATEWLHRVPLCAEDRAKLASGNAKRLLKL